MTPSEQLQDHQQRPRNLGKLLNASATGDVGSIVVGDALRFYLGIEQGRITAAKFQVFNAQDQLGASSALTGLVVGKTLDEAQALGTADLCRHLGGLDAAELPARLWAFDALESALLTWKGQDPHADAELDPLLCRCHAISEETVRQSIRVMELDSVDAIVTATGAGSGCGSCRVDMPRLLAEAKAPVAAPATPAPSGSAPVRGRIPLMKRIRTLVEGQVNPSLAGRGAIELVDFDGRLVTVRLGGAWSEDEARAALGTLEVKLRAELDPGLGVARVSAG